MKDNILKSLLTTILTFKDPPCFNAVVFVGVQILYYVKFTFVVNNANRSPKIRQYVKIVFCEKKGTSHAQTYGSLQIRQIVISRYVCFISRLFIISILLISYPPPLKIGRMVENNKSTIYAKLRKDYQKCRTRHYVMWGTI